MLLRAFAKINLDLRVLQRRADGYHEVRTVLQAIDWHDEIQMEAAERFEFVAHGAPADESNLVVRAVREFEKITGEPALVRIELRKNVPIGAGLGGGSADAAITVLGLQRILHRQLMETEQLKCMQALGSDVPFFAFGGRALGLGRGDEVSPLEDVPGENQHLVIVNPGLSISTAEAYSWLTVADKSNSIVGFCGQFVPGNAVPEQNSDQANDFERVVFARHPMLGDIRQELLELGALRASLSGSGSAVFGAFRAQADAVRAASSLSGNVAARVTRALQRPEYLRRVFGG